MTGGPRDRAGFTRRWGIHATWLRGAPWVSLGVHLDWHTPTLDLYIGKGWLQIGRNNHDFEGRVGLSIDHASGHTDQCLCAIVARLADSAPAEPQP